MKTLITITLLAASFTVSAMTEYETKMLTLETKRLELTEAVAKESIHTNKVQRCMAYKTYSVNSIFNAPEDCSFMVKAVDPSTVRPTVCKSFHGC